MVYRSFALKSAKYLIPFLLLASPAALADTPGDDMLTPDEIKTTGISSNPDNDSGIFIGAGLGFGQGRSTEEGTSPGTAYFLKFEPGYQANRGTWGRIEFSGEVYSGKASFRSDDLGKLSASSFGLMLHAGYGYSLGTKMFGVVRVGVGPVSAKFSAENKGVKYTADSVSGLATQIGWLMVVPMSGSMDATGGISWTQTQYDVDTVKSGSVEYKLDNSNVIVNQPAVEVGLRFRL